MSDSTCPRCGGATRAICWSTPVPGQNVWMPRRFCDACQWQENPPDCPMPDHAVCLADVDRFCSMVDARPKVTPLDGVLLECFSQVEADHIKRLCEAARPGVKVYTSWLEPPRLRREEP